MLFLFYKHINRMCSSCIYKSVQPELLNTAIGKQSTVTFPIGINTCTPESVKERLKLIWRPMNESMSALIHYSMFSTGKYIYSLKPLMFFQIFGKILRTELNLKINYNFNHFNRIIFLTKILIKSTLKRL